MNEATKKEKNIQRAPIVSVIGHIDHGKSTLLDYIRKENSVGGEVGGITQHISAYEVKHQTNKGENLKITFLDTPGHEAFHGERLRGIDIADITILIVAADDGVKEQTKESINAIKESGKPFIVAINKIDKESAKIDQTKQSLAENDVFLEGYGGQVSFVPISAITGKGIPELLELLLLTAELEELKGDPKKNATGVVLESYIDPQKGISATLIIKDGSLKKGMFVKAGNAISPIRIIEDFTGNSIEEAMFSTPVKIIGFKSVPPTGVTFETYDKKKETEEAIEKEFDLLKEREEETLNNSKNTSIEKLVIPVIIKADVGGSIEAIEKEFEKISYDEIEIKIIQKGQGDISESDVYSVVGLKNAIIVGFNVNATAKAKEIAETSEVVFKCFNIIYDLIDWINITIKEMKPIKEVKKITGELKVKKVFAQDKNLQVVGGMVKEGFISKNQEFKILRRGDKIGNGIISNLQQQKSDTQKVEKDNECGLQVKSKIEIAPGDILEGFTREME